MCPTGQTEFSGFSSVIYAVKRLNFTQDIKLTSRVTRVTVWSSFFKLSSHTVDCWRGRMDHKSTITITITIVSLCEAVVHSTLRREGDTRNEEATK